MEPATEGRTSGAVPVDALARPPAEPGPDRVGAVAGWLGRRATAVVVVLALAAGVWAVAGSQLIFPYLSDDHDEGLYLYQADALAHGHLFPPAPRHPDAFLPWLSVLSEGRFILKYTPVHASFLAAAMELTGTPRAALGFVAAGLVLLTYALAREVLGDRRPALVASLFLALSPLVVIQTTTFLSYSTSLLLLEAFALTLLRGLRTDGRLLLAASGFLLGLAAFARPFDALVFSLPLGAYLLWSRRRDRARLVAAGAWIGAGLALPLVAMLAYFEAATGSPFRSPFNLLEPQDTLGFGTRRLVPGGPGLTFTPAHGVYGVARYVLLTSFWGFGGLVLVGFFLASVLRRRLRGPQAWLALIVVSYSAGYLFFWGTFGTSLRGTLTSFLGPFYFLPILVPVTVLAGRGFTDLWRHDRFMAATALVVMGGVSGSLLVRAVEVNVDLTADDRRLYAAVADADLDRSLVLLPTLYGPTILHPFAWLWSTPEPDARTVYALDRGDPKNLALLRDHPDRTPYRVRVVESHLRANPPDPRFRTALERLTVVSGPSVAMSVTLENPTDDPTVVLSVAANGRRESFVLDDASVRGKRYEVRLRVEPGSVVVEGRTGPDRTEAVTTDELLTLSLETGAGEGAVSQLRSQRPIAFTVEGDVVWLLLPGPVAGQQLGPETPIGVPRPIA
ncbi:MAG TPA: glycosyltransferase family 39 protein [Acidimicrobiales bacterium]|nr:glycosyltransferase family 39 protein [Acidimicrobiales bacterium]